MILQIKNIIENGIEYEVRVYRGDRYWYLNVKFHRENGPAIEYTDGTKDWYWYGVYLTLEVLEQGIDQLSPEEIKFWLPILAAQKVA